MYVQKIDHIPFYIDIPEGKNMLIFTDGNQDKEV